MIPTLRLLRLLGALTLLGLAASVWPRLLPWWRGCGWLLGFTLLGDLCLCFWPKGLEGSRVAPTSFALGKWCEVSLRLLNPSPLPLVV